MGMFGWGAHPLPFFWFLFAFIAMQIPPFLIIKMPLLYI